MPYGQCKIYSDGSHYIAIPHTERPVRRRRPRKEETITVTKKTVLCDNDGASVKTETDVCPAANAGMRAVADTNACVADKAEPSGVYSSLYSPDGALLYGENPVADVSPVFSDGVIKEAGNSHGVKYYVFDRMTESGLWLRGVISEEESRGLVWNTTKLILLVFPLAALIAVAGGYRIASHFTAPINEIRRKAINLLVLKSKENYKFQRRETAIEYANYPLKTLDYSFNVSNDKAKAFYEKCSCCVKEPAPEVSKIKNITLMKTKHCLRDFANMCLKKNPDNKTLYLLDEHGQKYKLAFDCQKCVMKINTF